MPVTGKNSRLYKTEFLRAIALQISMASSGKTCITISMTICLSRVVSRVEQRHDGKTCLSSHTEIRKLG